MSLSRLLVPFVAARVLHSDADLLAIDKPAGLPVHGGPAERGDDLVGRLRAWLESRGSDPYLGVHQRLDQDASGAMVFSRRASAGAKVQAAFESHALARRYLAIVDGALGDGGTMRDAIDYDARTRRARVAQRGGKPSVARFRVLERRGGRALVELSPETGRTHQLRVQLASRGAPIAGDTVYGGATAPRLMLHAARLAIPAVGFEREAPMPPMMAAWLAGRRELSPDTRVLAAELADAGARRWPLADDVTVHRLVDGAADGWPGARVDRYGDYAVLSCESDAARERSPLLAELLREHGARGVYVKERPRADLRRVSRGELAPSAPLSGEASPETFEVREGPLRLLVDLADGFSTGVFSDQRDNRRRIAELSRGKRVLNLFCYTGAFTVAAALAGARETISVDISRRALDRLRENLELNGLPLEPNRMVREDAVRYLARARRRGERYDVVVVDPPSFSTAESRPFSVAKDYAALAADAIAVLAAPGTLLAVTNHRKTTLERFLRLLRKAAQSAGRVRVHLKALPMPLDFPDRPDGSAPVKSVLVRVE